MGSSLNMFGNIVSLSLVAFTAAQSAVPLVPGNVPGLVPGSPAADQWWQAQNIWREQQAHHIGKRQATEFPAGVSAALCPNYPFCNIAPAGYVNTAGYPAGVSAAACPNFPYCA